MGILLPVWDRLCFWWALIWSGGWRIVLALYTLASGYDLVVGQFIQEPKDWPRIADILVGGNLPWYVWLTGFLLLMLVITLEGAYSRISRLQTEVGGDPNVDGTMHFLKSVQIDKIDLATAFSALSARFAIDGIHISAVANALSQQFGVTDSYSTSETVISNLLTADLIRAEKVRSNLTVLTVYYLSDYGKEIIQRLKLAGK